MTRIVATVISLILAAEPVLWAAQSPATDASGAPSSLGATVITPPDPREARLRHLVEILNSLSDDDYELALSQAPEKSRGPEFASRGAALSSAYRTLAWLEYRKAAQAAPEAASARYTQAYERISGPKAGEGLAETGREIEVLKWLANAVLNYWVKGGETYVGRAVKADSQAPKADRTLAALDVKLADAASEDRAELHYQRGAVYESLSEAPAEPEAETAKLARKAARLRKLADLVGSVSDEDYREALKSAPASAKNPNLASRGKVLRCAYATLAALEYRQAVKAAGPEPAARYTAAYDRVARENAEALTVDPETMQETGWAMDLFKFMGNSVLNYWLHGGEDYMSRGWKGRGGTAAPEVSQEEAGAKLGPEKEAERHFEQGAVYENLAAEALKGDSREDLAALKAQRLKMLADLLESVSDEEYAEVVRSLPADSPGRSLPASRPRVLKGAYTTLAALEYRAAAEAAPGDASAPYQADLERVSRGGAKDLAVDPETLQETGWGTKLLGLLALGGIGYGVYELQRRRSRPSRPGAQAPGGGTAPGPGGGSGTHRAVSCPDGKRPLDGGCVNIGPLSRCPFGAASEPMPEHVSECLRSGDCTISEHPTTVDDTKCIKYRRIILPPPTPCPPGQQKKTDGRCIAQVVRVPYSCLGQRVKGRVECLRLQQRFPAYERSAGCPDGVDDYCLEHLIVSPEHERLLADRGRRHAVSTEAAALYRSVEGLESRLASADAGPVRAGLHQRIGKVYEELAAAAEGKPGTPAVAAPPLSMPAGPAAKDMLFLWDGSRLDGEVTAASPAKIVLKTDKGVTGVKQENVRALILRGAEVDADAEGLRASASQGALPLIVKADGTSARGRLASVSGQKLHFKMSGGVLSLSRDEVRAVIFPGDAKKPR
ncbi:MAG: hypothetical protein HY748_10820 [Elusimicrobia bacterium]|nr:hypothetical protein [Elusimicrobiota bacterium]